MIIALVANTDWYLYNFRRSLIEALRARGDQVVLFSPAGPYGERLRDAGFIWEPMPMERRSLNPFREIRLVLWLARAFRRHRIQISHGFTLKCVVQAGFAARFAGVDARVHAVAGLGYVFINEGVFARLLRIPLKVLLRLALAGVSARLILQNYDDVEVFEALRLADPAQIRLICGSGVDTEKFRPPDLQREPRGVPWRVALIGRVLLDKGVLEFVEAATLLGSETREIECILVGAPDPGNPASIPRNRIEQWEGNGVLRWLGHVEDMPTLLQSIDCVVLPSYREGLPKSLIEAAAVGLPLVATDVPGCRDVVRDGETGLLVPVRDGEALAQAIVRLFSDPHLARRLGSAARQLTKSRFDHQIVINQTLAVYDELAGDPV